MRRRVLDRRAALRALALAPAVVRSAAARAAAGPLAWTVKVTPARALLGEPIVAELICLARSPVEAPTFEDASLRLELRRAGGEPVEAFPNRAGVARGDVVERTAPAARRRLARGGRLARRLDLVETFPQVALGTGTFAVTFGIGPDAPLVAPPAPLTIESGPAAVPALIGRLGDASPGVRARAAGLLHRMTAHVDGYAPELQGQTLRAAMAAWRRWWDATGRRVAWSFTSDGATFEARPSEAPAPPRRRSLALGGISYRRRALTTGEAGALVRALAAWTGDPTAGARALDGRARVADDTMVYSEDDVMLDPGPEAGAALAGALAELAKRASARRPDECGADLILATIARCLDARFRDPLYTVESAIAAASAWRDTRPFVEGLLDVLDPSRNPLAGG